MLSELAITAFRPVASGRRGGRIRLVLEPFVDTLDITSLAVVLGPGMGNWRRDKIEGGSRLSRHVGWRHLERSN